MTATDVTRRALVVCDQWLGGNGYAGMKALRRAGWSVLVVPEWEFVPLRWRGVALRAVGRGIRSAAAAEFNQELLRQAERLRPELFVAFKGMFVHADTVSALRAMGVTTFCFFPDVSFRVHERWLPGALPRYDWVFVTKTFGARDMRDQLGMDRVSVLLHAFDPDLHRPLALSDDDRARYDCDVSFIGTWSPHKERMMAALIEARPTLRIRIWGEQWHRASAPAKLGSAVGGHEVTGEEYVRAIIASRINVALLSERRSGASDGDQVTSRTFHIPASGGFMLHQRTDELLALFREGLEVAAFGTADELIAQVDRYLADEPERAKIAAAGCALVRSRDSWDQRIREILARHDGFAA